MFVCLGLVLLVSGQTHAKRIYKSVDAEGNVTYSSKPAEDAKHIERIYIRQDYYSDVSDSTNTTHEDIKAAAEELEKDRKQRSKDRETARLKQEKQEAPIQAKQPVVERRYYYPLVPLYHYHRHPRHPARPIRPPHQGHPPRPEPNPHGPKQKLGAG